MHLIESLGCLPIA